MFSLTEGFFVPLDDVPELFRPVGENKEKDASGQRADLLYVTAARRGGLKFSFVEVKFRRYLKTARALDLLSSIESQLDASCQRWEKLFGPDQTDGQVQGVVLFGRDACANTRCPGQYATRLNTAFNLGLGLPDDAIVPREQAVAASFYRAEVFCPPTPSPTARSCRQRHSSQP